MLLEVSEVEGWRVFGFGFQFDGYRDRVPGEFPDFEVGEVLLPELCGISR